MTRGQVSYTNADSSEAIFGLGIDESDALGAAEVAVDSTTLVGTGTTVQAVFEELDDAVATELTYRPIFSTLATDSADVTDDILVDSGLTVTLDVGTYLVETLALVTTAAAADIDLKLTGTATVTETTSETMLVAGHGGDGTVAKLPVIFTTWDTETSITSTGAKADAPVLLKSKLVTTVAGTVKLQFAQTTTDASNTHIDKGSYMKAERVA